MERQLKFFFEFLENEKKLSENTLQSYKSDLKQFRRYIEACEVPYNRVKEEDIKASFKNGTLKITFPKEDVKKLDEDKKYIEIEE